MSLIELSPPDDWARRLAGTARRFGVNVRLYDARGASLAPEAQACNPLCRAVCGHPQAREAICARSHADLAEDAREEGKTVLGECEAGLGKILAPVFVSGRYVGAMDACGWLDPEGDVDTLLIEEETGIPEDELEAMAARVTLAATGGLRELVAELKDLAAQAVAKA